MDGVLSCAVSLATEEARVEYDCSKLGLRDMSTRSRTSALMLCSATTPIRRNCRASAEHRRFINGGTALSSPSALLFPFFSSPWSCQSGIHSPHSPVAARRQPLPGRCPLSTPHNPVQFGVGKRFLRDHLQGASPRYRHNGCPHHPRHHCVLSLQRLFHALCPVLLKRVHEADDVL
ncbi:hypothetical protein L7F22_057755 [Adiantum nelumboides]|nr:hypothetical protein [Adiantum nelumboides]